MSGEIRIRNAPLELTFRLKSIADQRGVGVPALVIEALEEWLRGLDELNATQEMMGEISASLSELKSGQARIDAQTARAAKNTRMIADYLRQWADGPKAKPQRSEKQPERTVPSQRTIIDSNMAAMGDLHRRLQRRST